MSKQIHGNSSEVFPLLARDDRLCLAAYRGTASLLPVSSLGRRRFRNS